MRLVLRGTERSPSRAGRAWRSTRAAAFFERLNGQSDQLDDLATRFPPERRGRLFLALAGVTIVALAVRVPLLGKGYSASDTTQFLEVAESIFHGGFPDNLRPPGYSLLLAVFDAFGADPVTAVVVLQNLIGIVLPIGVLLVGWRFFSPPVGVLAGLLTAASPLMIITEQLALSDYLFGVLLFSGTTLLAEAVLRIRAGRAPWRLLIAVGATFGVAALFRANGLIAFVAMPAALLLAARQLRPALRASAIAVAAMVVVLAPWALHNLIRFGDPSIASEGGVSLYARAISYDRVPPTADTPEGRLALSVYNTGDISVPRGELGTTVGVFNAFKETGRSNSEASSAMGGIAREAIFREPGIYLDNTIKILGLYRKLYDPRTLTANQYLDQIITLRNYFRTLNPNIQYVPGDSPLTRAAWQAGQTLTKLLYIVTLGGALALLLPFLGRSRSRLAAATFLIVMLLGFVGGSLTAVFSPRYDIMFAPMVWLVAAAAAVLAVEILVKALRPRSWRRPQGAEL